MRVDPQKHLEPGTLDKLNTVDHFYTFIQTTTNTLLRIRKYVPRGGFILRAIRSREGVQIKNQSIRQRNRI